MSKPKRISLACMERESLAWAAREFGQLKFLAVTARGRGDIGSARYWAGLSRASWRTLHAYVYRRAAS